MKLVKLLSFVFGSFGSITGVYFLSDTLSLSSNYPNYLKEIEVYFYDSSSSSSERIKLLLDSLDSNSKVQYYDSTDSKYKLLSSISSSDADKNTKYTKLAELARNYVQTQHYLNGIRSFYWQSKIKESSESFGLDKDKCCKGGCKCTDSSCCKSKDGKCILCLCCYLSSSTSQDCCCCKADSSCNFDDFKKQNIRFWYQFSNLNSASSNTYLSPVQAHIKLVDASFSSDFQSSSSSSSSSKKMIGTLIYGFLNYKWKEATFSDLGFSSTISSTIETSSKKYYSNVPQQFSFNIGTSESSDNNNLNNIFKLLSNKQKLVEYAKNPIKNNLSNDCCCCSNTEQQQGIDCLLSRNYVFELDNLSDIKTKLQVNNSSS